MNGKTNRRKFIKIAALSGAGMGLANSFPALYAGSLASFDSMTNTAKNDSSFAFIPNRAASWWCTIEDLQWPQKQITDKIKRRAEGFSFS